MELVRVKVEYRCASERRKAGLSTSTGLRGERVIAGSNVAIPLCRFCAPKSSIVIKRGPLRA